MRLTTSVGVKVFPDRPQVKGLREVSSERLPYVSVARNCSTVRLSGGAVGDC